MRYCQYGQPVIFGVEMEHELEESRGRNTLLWNCTERYWKVEWLQWCWVALWALWGILLAFCLVLERKWRKDRINLESCFFFPFIISLCYSLSEGFHYSIDWFQMVYQCIPDILCSSLAVAVNKQNLVEVSCQNCFEEGKTFLLANQSDVQSSHYFVWFLVGIVQHE